jgi:hypothetical protein
MSTDAKLNEQQLTAASLPASPASPSAHFPHAPQFVHVSRFKVLS